MFPKISETFLPLLFATFLGECIDEKASNVAFIILCGLEVPIDFATISCTPKVSKTALIGPPAITPVPGAAGGSIRTVLELAGIKNVLAKRLGSKTPLNNARAAMVALSELRTHKATAKERGISLEQIYS